MRQLTDNSRPPPGLRTRVVDRRRKRDQFCDNRSTASPSADRVRRTTRRSRAAPHEPAAQRPMRPGQKRPRGHRWRMKVQVSPDAPTHGGRVSSPRGNQQQPVPATTKHPRRGGHVDHREACAVSRTSKAVADGTTPVSARSQRPHPADATTAVRTPSRPMSGHEWPRGARVGPVDDARASPDDPARLLGW